MSTRRPLAARALRAACLLVALAAAGAGGCASAARALARPYALAPTGLEVPEQALRDALVAGRWADAGRRAASEQAGGPSDALLRALYGGTAAFYAGRWAESAAAFDRAADMADDRYTKRVSRGALALVTNDRALPYVPGDNERLFASYYATLAYLHAGDLSGATVEARRLAYALQRADGRRDPLDRSARAVLRYLTGAVFEAAGEREDAEVAYRNAAALGAVVDTVAVVPNAALRYAADPARPGALVARARGRRARHPVLPRAAMPAPGTGTAGSGTSGSGTSGTGEVVAVIEGGFVAHRVDERLSVRLDSGAAEGLVMTSGGVVVDSRGAGATAAWTPRAGSLGARLAALLTGEAGLWAGGMPAGLALADSAAAGVPADTAMVVGVPARSAQDVAGVLQRDGPPAPATRRHGGGGWERRGPPVWAWGRVFTVAWPAYRRSAWMPRTGGLVAFDAGGGAATDTALGTPLLGMSPVNTSPPGAGSGVASVIVRGDLSGAAAGDFRRDRGKLLARLVARAAVRASLAEQAGRTHRELGDLVRALGNVTEHADTRSWHLLPGEVQMVRLRLPAGAHALAVDVGGRQVPIGTVRVAAGAVRFVSARVWDAGGYRVTAAGTENAARLGALTAAAP